MDRRRSGGAALAPLRSAATGGAAVRRIAERLDRGSSADWDALAALPWVVTAAGTSNQEMREELFRPRGLSVNATVEANNDLLLRTLIADGLGIGLVRADHAEHGERAGVYALSTLGKSTTRLLFVYPEARAHDPVIEALLAGVRTSWPDA